MISMAAIGDIGAAATYYTEVDDSREIELAPGGSGPGGAGVEVDGGGPGAAGAGGGEGASGGAAGGAAIVAGESFAGENSQAAEPADLPLEPGAPPDAPARADGTEPGDELGAAAAGRDEQDVDDWGPAAGEVAALGGERDAFEFEDLRLGKSAPDFDDFDFSKGPQDWEPQDFPARDTSQAMSKRSTAALEGIVDAVSPDTDAGGRQSRVESQWWGRGAEDLGLSGQVDQADFIEILKGHVGGTTLGRADPDNPEEGRRHSPGWDITFSAPKSVSVLATTDADPAMRDAMKKSVDAALTFVESELAATRMRVHGSEPQIVQTHNLVVARFDHSTSRRDDPHLHTHAVVANATNTARGWRSLHSEPIFKAKALINAVHNNELAYHVRRAGYEIETTDKYGNWEIKDTSRAQLEAFSVRTEQIDKELARHGLTRESATDDQRQAANLATRASKTGKGLDELRAEWLDRASSVGLDLPAIAAAASDRSQTLGRADLDAGVTGQKALKFAAEHMFAREAVFSENDLLTVAFTHAEGRVNAKQIFRALDKLKADGTFIEVDPQAKMLTTKKMMAFEQTIEAYATKPGFRDLKPLMTPEQADAAIARAQKAESQAKGRSVALSTEQADAVRAILTSPSRVVVIDGLAGTGKTTMQTSLNRVAQEHGFTISAAAPSGRAAQELATATGLPADTMTMLEIRFQQDDNARRLAERQRTGDRNAPAFAPKVDARSSVFDSPAKETQTVTAAVLIDEATLAGTASAKRIFDFARNRNMMVVIQGDRLQLPSVAAGKPHARLVALAEQHSAEPGPTQPGVRLTTLRGIVRQRNEPLKEVVASHFVSDPAAPKPASTSGPNFIANARLARDGRFFDVLEKHGMMVTGADAKARVIADYVKSLKDSGYSDTIVVTPTNKARIEINQGVQVSMAAMGYRGERMDMMTLQPVDFSDAKKGYARYYQDAKFAAPDADLYVRFGTPLLNEVRGQANPIHAGEYGRVEVVDRTRETLLLRMDDGRQVEFAPRPNMKNLEVYRARPLTVMQGDVIRFTRKGTQGRYVNNETAEVVALNGSFATVQWLDSEGHPNAGKPQSTLDLRAERHVDLAYAWTGPGAQGASRSGGMPYIPTDEIEKRMDAAAKAGQPFDLEKETAGLGKVAGAQFSYVVTTRAKDKLTVYTENPVIARALAVHDQKKHSAVEMLEAAKQRANLVPTPADGGAQPRGRRRGQSI